MSEELILDADSLGPTIVPLEEFFDKLSRLRALIPTEKRATSRIRLWAFGDGANAELSIEER